MTDFEFLIPSSNFRFPTFDFRLQFPIPVFFFFSFLSTLLQPLLISSSCTHTHPHRAVTRTASLETLLGPCFVPQPVIPTPYRKTNIYTGLWAKTKLRLSFIHSELDRLGSNHPCLPVPFHYLSLPSFYIHYWRRI